MAETGVAIIISIGSYENDINKDKYNEKVTNLADLQSTIWGPKNMGYKLISLDQKSGYLSKNSLFDFIKESRFFINSNNYDYLVINIISKGNEEYLITSDNQKVSWLKIYELFSFAEKFVMPTVINIDVLNENKDNNKIFVSSDVDYGDNLNVFGYSSKEIDYFGFITNAIYQRKNAIYLKDVINHIIVWNKYIFTVPKDIDFDEFCFYVNIYIYFSLLFLFDTHVLFILFLKISDEDDHDYEQRESKDDGDDNDYNNNMFDENVKSVTSTSPVANDWLITYSIDRKSWGPFLSKYDFSAYIHDKNNNRRDIKAMELEIERPIGIKKKSKFKKILQNGSFVNETIREEGANAVGNTALSVIITNWNNQIITTPKITIT